MKKDPIIVPQERLSAETLRSLIEHFVLREGTEYGAREFTLEEKVATVQRQLDRGEVVIVFNEEEESCDIVPRSRIQRQAP